MDYKDLFGHIDDNESAYVADLQRIMRQPSVTLDDADCLACAELTVEMMEDAGFSARIVPSEHNPFVLGETAYHPDRPTLLVTSHYDVVEPGPREHWDYEPFSAELRDNDIGGRGAADPKGNLMASIKAAQALEEVLGDLPINIKWLIDGDDEGGRSEIGNFIETQKAWAACDAVLLVDAGFTRDGNSPVHLGTAGSLGIDITVTTGSKEPYFIWTSILPDAAYRLAWALGTLKDAEERILVEGFYDDVLAPTEDELALMAAYPWKDEDELAFWGVSDFVTGSRHVDAIRRLLYEPTCSIHGFEPSWTRAGGDSLIPNMARARINFHLVPNQDPSDILEKVRRHLDQSGFADVETEVFRSMKPMAGSADSPLGNAILRAAAETGVGSYLLPHSFEFGDLWCILGARLGVEGALIGIGDPDRRAHFPNEHITVPYYINGIKWVAATFIEYGRKDSFAGD